MSYDVGTHIDLRYLNKKHEVLRVVEKKTNFQEAVSGLYDVGTQFVFNFKQGKAQVARRIPVVYAA